MDGGGTPKRKYTQQIIYYKILASREMTPMVMPMLPRVDATRVAAAENSVVSKIDFATK